MSITTSSVIVRESLRDKVANFLVINLTPLYQLYRFHKKPWKTTRQQLSQFTPGSLGRALDRFLTQNGISLIPKAEFHDVWHVLFDYSTEMTDEMSIQFVVIGNGKWSVPYLVSSLVAIFMYPEHWGSFYKAYKKGQNAVTFYNWNFETLLDEDVSTLKKMIFNKE